jgi:hypothetical protein
MPSIKIANLGNCITYYREPNDDPKDRIRFICDTRWRAREYKCSATL